MAIPTPPKGAADIGVTGMAVMGSNLARNLARNGFKVAIHNRSVGKTEKVAAEHGGEGEFYPAESMADFVNALSTPRVAIIMVKAGAPTDAVIEELASLMDPGDIIVDCGNSNYHDTRRREADIRARGLHFVGSGVSGGEEGALNGPSIMPGGTAESYNRLGPMAYDLMRKALGMSAPDIGKVFEKWNATELDSYLIEITADVLQHYDFATGEPFIDVVLDRAGQKGTGAWTVQNAAEFGVPVTGIAEATFARSLSGGVPERQAGRKALPAGVQSVPVDDLEAFVEDIRQALYASKMVAYSQGFELIRKASAEYGWNVDLGAMARIWRGGCIIRAVFLNRITEAYERDPELALLLADPYFTGEIGKAVASWRRVVSYAALTGVPIPAFASSLAYYDGVRAERLPANLIQGQRDYFGAHTYRRVDREGTFHTLWSGDRSEVRED